MRTTFLPPHLAAQTFATQPPATRAPQQAGTPPAASDGGFEALALKSANPTRVIAPRAVEQKPAAVSAPSPTPAASAAPAPAPGQTPTLDRLLRPGARLDIRV